MPSHQNPISIHASAREATQQGRVFRPRLYISIHASAREATHVPKILIIVQIFQSTLPRGKRRKEATQLGSDLQISIHASAREATCSEFRTAEGQDHFNPRFREGSDRYCPSGSVDSMYFNPRFREGSDSTTHTAAAWVKISIHASAREATRGQLRGRLLLAISIHASAREATLNCSDYDAQSTISIHASAREATPEARTFIFTDGISIHASAREATAAAGWRWKLPAYFNPRFREGSDSW